jgi:transposase
VSTNYSGHYGDGVARQRKRLWTDEEKRSIYFQTTAPGVSVTQVARRYAVNANLIFKWLRDCRYAPDPALIAPPAEEARFLPVEIFAQTMSAPAALADNHIATELAGSHRMRISGSYDPQALARLIREFSVRSRLRPAYGSGWRRVSPTCARTLGPWQRKRRRC